jgi:hypothetical protein
MKRLCMVSMLFIAITSCGGNSSDNDATNTTGNTTDTGGLTNPTAIDTTKHPTGMDNSSVISTDTAAMNTSNAYKKADSANQKK